MMITSLWYVAYRAPTELFEVLLRCRVEFYTLVDCFWFTQQVFGSSRSWEVLAKIQVLWIFGSFIKFVNFWYWGSQDKWDLYLM